MFFWNKICGHLFFFVLFSLSASAQKSFFTEKKYEIIRLSDTRVPDSLETVTAIKNLPFPTFTNTLPPENFAVCTLGFFCRQEIKLEKAIKIPVRFRLGSLKQCNYYEGK